MPYYFPSFLLHRFALSDEKPLLLRRYTLQPTIYLLLRKYIRVYYTTQTILGIELIARESNQRAINFYQTLGFVIEGKMLNRIQSVDGGFEADIAMAWFRQ